MTPSETAAPAASSRQARPPQPPPRGGRTLRVAQLCAEPFLSGAARRLGLLLEGLAGTDVDTRVLCTPSSRLAVLAQELELPFRELGLGGHHLRSLLQVRSLLARERVDVLHVHGSAAASLGRAAALLSGVPLVRTYDGEARPGRLARVGLRGAVATTPESERELARRGLDARRIHAIPAPVHAGRLRPTAGRELTRAAEGAAPDDVVVLALGSMQAGRGHELLLRALARLIDAGAPAYLWIAGDGPLLVELDRLRRELELVAHAGFLGRRDDVGDLIAASDVVVDAGSVPRPTLGVAEAMALGRPVVATAIGGAARAVLHDRTGLVVPPGDEDALALALLSVVTDRALRERLGAAGPARIAEGFRLDQVAERHVELYASLARRR